MAEIHLKSLCKSYGSVQVIRNVNLKIFSGEFMVFVGPSGCGKSTLLRLISGLEDITSGDLFFDGERMNRLLPSKRGIAMVFQSYALYPHMTVFNNIAFGLKLSRQSREQIRERVEKAARLLQIENLLERLPRQLSGGQRQRVAIGRAIVRNPRVFLFDEPLSNLDAALRVATRLEIAKLHQDMESTTMIYVTHDQVEAMTLADRICVLREGHVEQVGTPEELYARPNSLFVAGFIGSPRMNFLKGKAATAFDCPTLGVRAEHVEVVKKGAIWTGRIAHMENLGADSFLFVELEGLGKQDPFVVRQPSDRRFSLGEKLRLKPIEAQLHRFDENEQRI